MNVTLLSSGEMISLKIDNPDSNVALDLMKSLSIEIGTLYGDYGNGDFKPTDIIDGGTFIIAYENDNAVGCGALRKAITDGVGEIKRMYVIPKMRGKKIAIKILEKLEEIAHSLGYKKIILETGLLQKPAMHLYEKMGYSVIPCFPPHQNNPYSICYSKELT